MKARRFTQTARMIYIHLFKRNIIINLFTGFLLIAVNSYPSALVFNKKVIRECNFTPNSQFDTLVIKNTSNYVAVVDSMFSFTDTSKYTRYWVCLSIANECTYFTDISQFYYNFYNLEKVICPRISINPNDSIRYGRPGEIQVDSRFPQGQPNNTTGGSQAAPKQQQVGDSISASIIFVWNNGERDTITVIGTVQYPITSVKCPGGAFWSNTVKSNPSSGLKLYNINGQRQNNLPGKIPQGVYFDEKQKRKIINVQ